MTRTVYDNQDRRPHSADRLRQDDGKWTRRCRFGELLQGASGRSLFRSRRLHADLFGFIEKADELKAKGIDEIACTAVNDAFVMGAWGKSAAADGKVTMLADGNGDFAKAVDLTMDGSKFGLGQRGQRFSMVVNDGVVEQLNIEGPGEFKVSSAEHMLSQL
jgi:hypothetical protein